MWTPTAEGMIGIQSEVWPTCNDGVPLVQWLRKALAWTSGPGERDGASATREGAGCRSVPTV